MASLTADGIFFATSDELNSRRQIFALSAAWCFFQSAAPTGWTKVTTHNNKALRVVSGNGGGSGGTNPFTDTMTSFTVGGELTMNNYTDGAKLSPSQIPGHSHGNGGEIGVSLTDPVYNPDGEFVGWSGGDVGANINQGGWSRNYPGTGDAGGSVPHSHLCSATGTVPSFPISIAVQYVNIIVCTFDG